MRRKPHASILAVILALLIGTVFLTSCPKDNSGRTRAWTDPDTGLMWQNGSQVGGTDYTWQGAKDYCASLSWAGYHDWRLPDIDELRSLIRGCGPTETGGACGVTDGCLNLSCLNYSCEECDYMGGPGFRGIYWPPDVSGVDNGYWSSSPVADSDPGAWWFVAFDSAYIYDDHIYGKGARCVR